MAMDDDDRSNGLAPNLLLSMPQLTDPNFERTVLLLCEHTPDGAFGLVLNRPTTTAAAEVVNLVPPVEATSGPLLWVGGPVEPQRGWILLGGSPTGVDEDATEVAPGIYLSTSLDLLRRVLLSTPPRARVLTGYSGWGPGQLDAELAASAWLTMETDPALIFDTPADQMWDRAIRKLGADPAFLQSGQGVH
ncbi:MAG: YqgE/AlgH family protein [Luteitalea sp.]|nr:YqgE/AlgH family protein [Luteitalea sp.]